MASSRQIMLVMITIAIVGAVLQAYSAAATEHIVGDAYGWGLNFNYTKWAEGRTFHVGDKLVFKYKPGSHNVHRVSGPEFQACMPAYGSQPLTSGNDVITLATPGRKWYLCGVGYHCAMGQKLVITVMPLWTPAPPPPPPPYPAATEHVVGGDYGWTLGVNYTAWAEGKTFRVGDKLVFKYMAGSHNVYRVSGPEFQACKPANGSQPLTTGNDVVTLAIPGRKWYLCGVEYHCAMGQKLFITVVQPAGYSWPAMPPTPAATMPPPPYSFRKILGKKY